MAYMNNYELAAAVRSSMDPHPSSRQQFSFPWNGRGFAFSPHGSSLLHNRCSSEFGSAMAAVKAAGCFGAKELQEFYTKKNSQVCSSSAQGPREDPASAYYRDSDSSASKFPSSKNSAKQQRSDDESLKVPQGASVNAPFANFTAATGNLSSSSKLAKHDHFSSSTDKSAAPLGLISSEKITNTNLPQALIFLKDQNLSEPLPQLGDQTKDQQSNPTSEHPTPKKRKIQPQKQVVYVPLSSGAIRPNGGGGMSSDVWAWRKYGQKPIKGSPYPRGYYRCSSSKGCSARKQVEKSRTDPSMLIVTYTSEHNHPLPNAAISNSSAPTTPSAENNINSIPAEKPIAHDQEGQDASFFCSTEFPDASPAADEAKSPTKSMQTALISDEQAVILAQGSDHELKKLSKKLTAQDEDFFATLEELTVSTSPLFKTSLVDPHTDDEVSGGVVIDSYHIFSWAGDNFAEKPDHPIAQF